MNRRILSSRPFFLSCLLLIFAILGACASTQHAKSQVPMTSETAAVASPSPPPGANPGDLLVGASRVDISPDHSVMMGGYGIYLLLTAFCRWSEGTHDPLYATALYIEKNGQATLFIEFDLVGLVQSDIADIRKAVTAKTGISPDRIVVASTHTHHSPDTVGLWGTILPPVSGRDEPFMQSLRPKAAEAAAAAFKARRPAKLFYAVGEQSEMHVSDHAKEIKDAPIDHTLTLLKFTGMDGKIIATVLNWGCHPTSEDRPNRLISADWVGAYYREMRSRSDGIPMYLQASLGAGIVPSDAWRDRAIGPEGEGQGFRWADAMGKALAVQVTGMMSNMSEANIDGIRMATKSITVPMMNKTFRLGATLGIFDLPVPKVGEPFMTYVTQVRMGPVAFATMPGEMSPQLGLEIRKVLDGGAQVLIGLGQDWLGYMIDQKQYADERYAYEKMLCLGPDLGPAVVQAHRDIF